MTLIVARIFLLGLLTQLGYGELFTAMVEMEALVDVASVIVDTLNGYIAAEEAKLSILRRHLDEIRAEHDLAKKGVQKYLNNPLNAYLMTKKLTSDWKQVEKLMNNNVGKEFAKNITQYKTKNRQKFPTSEDLGGAATALIRLQDVYKLNTSSLARGEINGRQLRTKLTSHDCFELGRHAFKNEDYFHSILWMTEAKERYFQEKNKTTTKPDILEHLAYSYYMEGNVSLALRVNNEILELQPGHKKAKQNKIFYEKALKRGEDGKKQKIDDGDEDAETLEFIEDYKKLCRGENGVPEDKKRQLKCRYVVRGKPFLKIGPLKEEEAYLDPRIVIYHDVIYDTEIKTYKRMATKTLNRATVADPDTGKNKFVDYRVSKSGWLNEEDDPLVAKIARRTEDMTGLSADTAEYLQVVNYGIGGHYEPHYDHAEDEEPGFPNGNRIATVLFYMSDVEYGGATVFPHIKVSLLPKKGTAAVWMNLLPSGAGDENTAHAACPVLIGSKWVANKWFHEHGQEFLKPCQLKEKNRFPPYN